MLPLVWPSSPALGLPLEATGGGFHDDTAYILNFQIREEIQLAARSWGASTPLKICTQADLDSAGALGHMKKKTRRDLFVIRVPEARSALLFC